MGQVLHEIASLFMIPEIVSEIIIRNRKSAMTDAEGRLIFRGHDTQHFSMIPSPEMQRANAALVPIFKKAMPFGGNQAGGVPTGRLLCYLSLLMTSDHGVLSERVLRNGNHL